MAQPLWQLLLREPSGLDCDECFAVMEYYAEKLAVGGADLLPQVMGHLQDCPDCEVKYREALHRLEVNQLESERGENL
jgi:hypothetical protein